MFPIDQKKEDLGKKYQEIKLRSQDGRVFGFSKFFDVNGKFEWKRCELLQFKEEEDIFQIKWIDSTATKNVTRSNFYFELEDFSLYNEMVDRAKIWRKTCGVFLKYYDMVQNVELQPLSMKDTTKDKIITLSLNLHYQYCKPRNPLRLLKLQAVDRFNFAEYMNHKPKLLYPANYDVIEDFKQKRYNLKVLNRLSQELEENFTHANRQIEFDKSMPYSIQL